MRGTPGQIGWAELIKPRVDAEFDRVSSAFVRAAATQSDADRADTEIVMEILAEKRVEVLSNEYAGYFIREWRDLTDQVRSLIAQDSRYKAIQDKPSLVAAMNAN